MKIGNYLALGMIKFYQVTLGAFLPASCRFHPSCSQYALAAFKSYPFSTALGLSLKRLLKCHPWHPGGFDPLPTKEE